jgi:DNA-binding MarR family transcriptional regulator
MEQNDVMEEIRSLRLEMGSLGDHMVRVRYVDLRRAFLEQMRMALGELGREAFRNDARDLGTVSTCPFKEACLSELEEAMGNAFQRLTEGDLEGAEDIMGKMDEGVAGCTACQDERCSHDAREAIDRVSAILWAYRGIMERLGADAPEGVVGGRALKAVSPQLIEEVLDPLANAWRIRVLTILRRGDHSLSEIGRAVDLRTGHLQFHLRKLIQAGYVEPDRRRRVYHMTERGRTALQWSEELAAQLGHWEEGHG